MKFLSKLGCLLFFSLFIYHSACAQKKSTAKKSDADSLLIIRKGLTDDQLLELVQKQTFRYFWEFAHPVSGLARERSNLAYEYGHETTTIGGTGFGIMAIVVASERGWISRDTAVGHLLKMVKFLAKADKYHGVFPHWMNGATGKTIPFSSKDDGADLVETSYLIQGLLAARQYFNGNNPRENQLRNRITWMWNDVEWKWHTREGLSMLFWHWSPNNGWTMNHEIRGWNECLITYVLAASSPRYSISQDVYHRGWANSSHFKNQREYYGIKLPLGFDYGGPLFFAHYSFLGIDPKNLKDNYADYWIQNLNHTLINREHCIRNPNKFKGYGENCWGLTASDNHRGYGAHSPTEDLGVISPTAALSSFPYTPEHSMKALRHFYEDLGDKIWSEYGFVDAFNESENWYAKSHLAIDQGPIIVMIENYRTGLLWKLFMSVPEVQNGMKKLGFQSPSIK
ncbi:MAG: glucoamylase family protein [Chitinophagaceae bacterium]